MHRSFATSLTDGHAAERAWVERLRTEGYAVAHGRKIVLTQHDSVRDHCGTPDAAAVLVLEIKERKLRFTGPEDYPYPTVFVNATRSLEMDPYRPFAYIFVSTVTRSWVWLTPLDRDSTWKETTVTDTTRGHDMGMLVAPKKFLRPARQLIDFLVPHHLLEGIDGDTECFRRGGGKTEERERYAAKTDPRIGSRDRKAPGETHWNVG